MKNVLKVIAAERIPENSTGFLYRDEVNEILDRVEAAVHGSLPKTVPAVSAKWAVSVFGVRTYVQDHCSQCKATSRKGAFFCANCGASLDWSEGGEA